MAPGRRFRKTKLDNGLRILTEQVPFVRSVSLGAWVQVGSRDERDAERGISHFLEHMLFKGTQKRDAFQIVHSLESLGGSLDAFTYRDLTCFYARCLDEHIDMALDVLLDMLQNPRLDAGEIQKEKGVVLEEIQNVEDTPEDLVHDLFARSVWGRHPVGAPILGTPETVRTFTGEALRGHLDRTYRPDRMVISAAGNLDHDHLVDMVCRLFKPSGAAGCQLVRERPTDAVRTECHYQRDVGQTHICLGTTAYAYTHPQQYDLLVANTALGGGMSSRLFQHVRERLGLAYAVYSYLEALEDTGLLGVYLACDRARAGQSIEIVRSELSRFRREGISKEELESCKAQLRGELILGYESMDRRMGRIAREEIYTGRYHSQEEWLVAINRVTREGVLEVCEALMDENRMHLITLGR